MTSEQYQPVVPATEDTVIGDQDWYLDHYNTRQHPTFVTALVLADQETDEMPDLGPAPAPEALENTTILLLTNAGRTVFSTLTTAHRNSNGQYWVRALKLGL